MKKQVKTIAKIICFALPLAFISCDNQSNNEALAPKPRGYFRITTPQNTYQKIDIKLPYTFEYSSIARIETEKENPKLQKNWINIVYPKYNATIYITYSPIHNNLANIVDDSYRITYRHSIKADAISESTMSIPDRRVFCLLSDVEGNAASPIQFMITDSTRNFLRGSLYFYSEPNADSVAPVVNFIRKDIIQIMQTTEWNK